MTPQEMSARIEANPTTFALLLQRLAEARKAFRTATDITDQRLAYREAAQRSVELLYQFGVDVPAIPNEA